MFSKWRYHVKLIQTMYEGFNFSTSSLIPGIVHHLGYNHLSGLMWYLTAVLACIPLKIIILSLLCAYWPFVYLQEMFIQILCSFCNCIVFVLLSCKNSVCFGYWTLMRYVQILSPLPWVSFDFLDSALWNTNVLILMSSDSSLLFLVAWALMPHLKNHCLIQGQKNYTCFISTPF